MAKQKYYVVWKGVTPGVYTSWTDCQLQIKNYKGALYKSFETREEAEAALASPAHHYLHPSKEKAQKPVGEPQLPGLPFRTGTRDEQHRRVPRHRTRTGPAAAKEPADAHLFRQPECLELGPPEKMQDQTGAYPKDRAAFPTHRTGRELAPDTYLYHSPAEMGNRTLGRSSRRLRP